MAKRSQHHDLFYKSFMQEKPLAAAFLKIYLPDFIRKLMDFSTLTLVNHELLPAPLKKLQSDVVFQCKINHGKDDLYIILEHQSTAHQLMPLRIHEYITALMRYHLKQGQCKLPLVLPVVVYHGCPSPYNVSSDLWDLFNNRTLAEQIMFKAHQVIDISAMTDKEIASHGAAALLEWPLRDAKNRGEHFLDKVKIQLPQLFSSDSLDSFPDFKLALYRYILLTYRGSKSLDEVIDELTQVAPEEKEAMLTAGQQLEQRGMQQGMQQGIQQGMQQGMQQGEHKKSLEIAKRLLKKGMSLEDIVQITGLAKKELKALH